MSDIATTPAPADDTTPSTGAAPVDGSGASNAPATASWIGLTVDTGSGSLQVPFAWVDAPADSPDVSAALDAFAAATPEFPVTVDVGDMVTITGDALSSTRDDLVSALSDLGLAAGYDGDAATISAKVDGADASVSGEGTADGLVDAAANVHDFPGTLDDATDTPDKVDVPPSPDAVPMGLTADGRWEGALIVEGILSGDNRMIQENALTHRDLPLPLMGMFRNPDGGDGHDGAELVGSIETIERRDGGVLWGTGQLDLGGPSGREAYRLLGGPVDEMGNPDPNGKRGPVLLRGVSADLDRVEVTWENQIGDDIGLEDMLGFDPGTMYVTAGRIMGATLCQFPSFMEAQIALVDETNQDESALAATAGYATQARVFLPWTTDALVASADLVVEGIPMAPPRSWMERPTDAELSELRGSGRALRVNDDGRWYGFAAVYGELHIGLRKPTHVPRSRSGYAFFRTGEVVCDDGSRVATGPIVMDCVHPDLTWVASDAATFYAHTGAAIADCAVWDDDRAGGIVIAGALRPGITQRQLRAFRASDGVSPDWRHIGGVRECVAMLVVNNSGFKTPALVASAALEEAGDYVEPGTFACHFSLGEEEPLAMVAAGTFAARRPDSTAGLTALASVVAGLRRELRQVQTAQRNERAKAALARLQAVTE